MGFFLSFSSTLQLISAQVYRPPASFVDSSQGLDPPVCSTQLGLVTLILLPLPQRSIKDEELIDGTESRVGLVAQLYETAR